MVIDGGPNSFGILGVSSDSGMHPPILTVRNGSTLTGAALLHNTGHVAQRGVSLVSPSDTI